MTVNAHLISKRSWLVLSVILGCYCLPAMAQTPPKRTQTQPKLTASMTQNVQMPKTLKVGDPFKLTLDITHPTGAKIIEPQSTSKWWSIVSTKTQGVEQGKKTQLTLTLVAWRSGSRDIGPLLVDVMDSSGQRAQLKTTPFSIKAISTLPMNKNAEDFKGARRPVAIFIEDMRPLWLGLGVFSVVMTAFFVFFLMRRRLEAMEPEAPPQLPHVIALERLSQLAASDLIERQDFKGFYTQMSEVVREFLGKQFGFPGTELTTTEMEDVLQQEDWPNSLSVSDISAWLSEADYVKFTETRPTSAQAEASLRQAFTIVELTRHHQDILAEQAAQLKAQQEGSAQADTSTLAASTTPAVKQAPDEPAHVQTTSGGMAAWAAILEDADEAKQDLEEDNALQADTLTTESSESVNLPTTEALKDTSGAQREETTSPATDNTQASSPDEAPQHKELSDD